MDVKIDKSWYNELSSEFDKEYFWQLRNFIHSEYKTKIIYPQAKNIFAAFDLCPFDSVKLVIIGQDPYHEPGQAHGLCFSVQDGCVLPPSLRNIYKEIETDLGKQMPFSGDLSRWAKQGVLLLNATLTVEAHKAGSHQNKGWEEFTDKVIEILSKKKENLVFMLWGSYAQKKGSVIDAKKHLILKAVHPSPLSAYRGFFGSKHFSQANNYLISKGIEPIDW
ncbi:MAG: uracil-DNA glycosylase [Bacteroidales bacterium]|jgi:uracil-DNA glycosylase|nr:uracil-DNA glycosylase [Bacteroidales bacterium]